MRKTVLGMAMAAILVISSATNSSAVSAAAGGWSDQSNCLRDYGNCGWCVTAALSNYAANQMPIDISIAGPGRIVISYQRALTQGDDKDIVLANDVTVPSDVCADLGVTSIVLRAGTYTASYTSNNNGDYTLRAVITQ